MNIKLLALDLDDTTLSTGGVLTDYNRQALLDAMAHGIEVVVASGRNYTSLPKCITELSGIRYAIVSNGASIYDVTKNERIVGFPLPKEAVALILREVKSFEACRAEVIIDSIAYAPTDYLDDPLKFSPPTISPHIVEYLKTTRHPVDDFYGFAEENAQNLDCVNITFTSADDRIAFQKRIEEQTDDVYLTSSIGHLLEISNKHTGKGSGMRKVCEMLNIPLPATCACGNADNDIDMILSAAIGAAVENATESCKAAADIIIPKNTENGVGQFIYKLLSEKESEV
ncbi:MAG: HAD family phosphatase [Oscillospiraceae bacterium]|nr:HAD family phosphatase [Oscillospiraceae bacterium]